MKIMSVLAQVDEKAKIEWMLCSKCMKSTLPVTYKAIQGDLTLTQVTEKTKHSEKSEI